MAQREQDRRVRRTRRLLQQALVELMAEKDFKDITVRELTLRADVNRGTFYSHYKDLYDMLEQTEEELFGQITLMLEAYQPERLQQDLTPILLDVFRFVRDNRELCLTMLNRQEGERFFQRLRALIYDMSLHSWGGMYPQRPGGGPNYYLEFVVSGAVGLIQAWMQGGMREPPEEMAGLTKQMIAHGLPFLEENQPALSLCPE